MVNSLSLQILSLSLITRAAGNAFLGKLGGILPLESIVP